MVRVGPFMSVIHQKMSISNSLLRRYAGGDELLPEEIFDIAARETCRFKRVGDCASFIARWFVDHPNSSVWRSTLSALRKTAGAKTPSFTAARLARLRALFGERVATGEDAASPGMKAQRVTDFFLNYYNHVVPFDRRALEEAWGRCDDEDCEVGRARAAELLWRLDGSTSR